MDETREQANRQPALASLSQTGYYILSAIRSSEKGSLRASDIHRYVRDNHKKISRQSLHRHLRELTHMEILVKQDREYYINPARVTEYRDFFSEILLPTTAKELSLAFTLLSEAILNYIDLLKKVCGRGSVQCAYSRAVYGIIPLLSVAEWEADIKNYILLTSKSPLNGAIKEAGTVGMYTIAGIAVPILPQSMETLITTACNGYIIRLIGGRQLTKKIKSMFEQYGRLDDIPYQQVAELLLTRDALRVELVFDRAKASDLEREVLKQVAKRGKAEVATNER